MGCGKSSVGKLLAEHLKMQYVDLDDFIEEKEQLTIKQIFDQKGEVYFRRIETKYLQECLDVKTNAIISLGGGTPCFGQNMDIVNQGSDFSIYLQTSIVELTDRLFNERAKRPLIAHTTSKEELQEFIGKHIFERIGFYTQSKFKVITDQKSIQEIVSEIEESIS